MTDTTDIRHALSVLALTTSGMKPHSVGYLKAFEPDRADILDFQNDLVIVAGLVDRVFEAYADYFIGLGIISETDKRVYFTRIVMDAIEGHALYAVERGIEQIVEERLEAAE